MKQNKSSKRLPPQNPLEIVKYYYQKAQKLRLKYPDVAVISTCVNNKPNSRCVLIKEINDEGLIFYTNYQSQKGQELSQNPNIALVFYWEKMDIQIRIRGIAQKVPPEVSDRYFKTRPKGSQISAIISKQSQELESYKKLMQLFEKYLEEYKDKEVKRPEHWGGYIILPEEIEIWKEKPHRLHKRILYYKKNSRWYKKYLYP
ncbi:MAG: pyridoxamine 5'-phosphate oxidase [bacterium]